MLRPSSWLVAMWLLCVPAIAGADQTTGSISLVIAQGSDRTTTVDVSSGAQTFGRRSAEARGTLPVTIRNLPPGTYDVAVTFPDRSTVRISVAVGAAEIVSLRGQAANGSGRQATVQVFDRAHLAQGTYLDEREVRALPVGSGVSAWLDTVVPFVIAESTDTGGLALGTNVRVGTRVASAADATLSLGDFVAERAPGGDHRPVLLPDPSVIETLSVSGGLASADVAAPGAVVTIVAKRPGDRRHASIDASFSDAAMVSSNHSETAPSIARLESWKSGSVSFGGPVVRHTGAFVTGSWSDMLRHERNLTRSSNAAVSSVFAHVIRQPTGGRQFRAIAGFQNVRRPFGEIPQFREAGIDERQYLFQSQATWDLQRSHGERLTVGAGYERGQFTPSAALPSGTGIDRARDGLIPVPAGRTTADRAEARLIVGMPQTRGHAIELGLSAARATSAAHQIDVSTRAELVDGLGARVWIPAEPITDSRRAAAHVAAYVTDHWTAGHGLTLDLGLRAGRSTGAAAGGDRTGWNAVLPRSSFRWASTVATVYGGFGRYQSELPLELLAFGDPGEPVVDVYRWNDLNLDRRIDAGEVGVRVARSGHGRSIASIDPNLRAAYTDEVVIGIERRLGTHLVVRAAQIHRAEHSLARSRNVGAPISNYDVRLIPDRGEDYDSPRDDRLLAVYDRLPSSFGQDRYLLTNAPDETALYDGTEIGAEWRSARWWSMAIASSYDTYAFAGNRGFRADENDPGLTGELLENPNAYSYPRGIVFYDRSYVLKWVTGYQAPHDFTICAVARYQDGQPFSRLVVVPDLAQGAELVSAYRAGRTRFTFTSTLDVRVEKGFSFGGLRAAVRVEIYNLPNLGYEIEENPVSGPAFRRTTAIQPPRAVRVGLRVDF